MDELIKISEEQLISVQVVKSIFTVYITQSEQTNKIDVTGVSVIPRFLEVKPNNIRNSIIKKEQVKGGSVDIEENIRKGIYFINISDYTSEEIIFLSKYVVDKMFSEIWGLLTVKELKPFQISLENRKVKEIILEENPELFINENEFESFCKQYGLSVKDFIEYANFSELEIKLKEIEARFEMEQFFARRYLFCSTLIDKLENRISEFTQNGNKININRLKTVNSWIERMRINLTVMKEFTDFQKLYDMPKTDKNIEISNSSNINIIGGDISDSQINQDNNSNTKSESKFSRRVKIWTLIFAAIGIIITLLINWDSILN